MKTKSVLSVLFNTLAVSLVANCFAVVRQQSRALFVLVPLFLLVNVWGGVLLPRIRNKRVLICQHGTVMLYAFCGSLLFSAVYQIVSAVERLPHDATPFWWGLLWCVVVHVIVFWNGILCVYLTSAQLGFKWRLVGIVCGLLFPVNLIVLGCMLKITTAECWFEADKLAVNQKRKDERLCATRYPLLLVHGVFFRDTKFFNYWGRIPAELEQNGATVFYGNHASAASVADSAAELKARIDTILAETGAEKVNIIAHSKGGLDCRYAMAKLGADRRIASLTTINTPHRGCLFADYLLTKLPAELKNKVANTYNATLKKLGEQNPDFLAAVSDLTDARCRAADAEMPPPDGVYCQSVGSVLTKAKSGKFPLNFSYHLVNLFSGENDGLVSESSFRFGERYTLLRAAGKRGISHGDMIDLNRENIRGFDVREFYVNLVHDLKNRGL